MSKKWVLVEKVGEIVLSLMVTLMVSLMVV